MGIGYLNNWGAQISLFQWNTSHYAWLTKLESLIQRLKRDPKRSKILHQGDNISIGAQKTKSPVLNKFLHTSLMVSLLFKVSEVTLRLTEIMKHCNMVQIGRKCFFDVSQIISIMGLDQPCRAFNVIHVGRPKRSSFSHLFRPMHSLLFSKILSATFWMWIAIPHKLEICSQYIDILQNTKKQNFLVSPAYIRFVSCR